MYMNYHIYIHIYIYMCARVYIYIYVVCICMYVCMYKAIWIIFDIFVTFNEVTFKIKCN